MQSGLLLSRLGRLFSFLIAPTSRSKEIARKELVLNILLLGSILMSLIAVLSVWQGFFFGTVTNPALFLSSAIQTTVVFLVFVWGLWLSKKGHVTLVSLSLILLYFWVTSFQAYIWGASFPEGLLLYALIILMSAILIGPQFTLAITALIIVVIVTLIRFQSTGVISTHSSWRTQLPNMNDALVYGTTLAIMCLLAWLYITEMNKTLKRAQRSELALKKQRDNLEMLVGKRTEQLRVAQVKQFHEIYRFAEFGKLASGLFHDIATPLNVISLNLHQINSQQIADAKASLERALQGTQRLEHYIQSARRQMQNEQQIQLFSANQEIDHVINILQHRIIEMGISIDYQTNQSIELTGSPVKFYQLAINLITNAIDAYQGSRKRKRPVKIDLSQEEDKVILVVKDTGNGIAPRFLKKIFLPLFSTKGFEQGTGMGLFICKEIVEKDFNGQLTVTSTLGKGSTFVAQLR